MLAVSSPSAIGDYSRRIMSELPDPSPSVADDLADATPMMAQYLVIKRAHADCLLFYRMGDFYEMFFEDAVNAAAALDIALTKRGRHAGEEIPMCGVPVVSHEAYLMRLIRKGFRVAASISINAPSARRESGDRRGSLPFWVSST